MGQLYTLIYPTNIEMKMNVVYIYRKCMDNMKMKGKSLIQNQVV